MRSIQAVYKLEDNELGTEQLGGSKTLLFWEAAEGGAGVLTQLLENPQAFQTIAQTALETCPFQEEKSTCTHAYYECLLSYSNQFDHRLINRHLVKGWLEQLLHSQLKRQEYDADREAQYRNLEQKVDPNSRLEKLVLDEVYRRGIQLPDSASKLDVEDH